MNAACAPALSQEGELDEQLVYEACTQSSEPHITRNTACYAQGDEWVFRMEMPAIFHKFIVGSRAAALAAPASIKQQKDSRMTRRGTSKSLKWSRVLGTSSMKPYVAN